MSRPPCSRCSSHASLPPVFSHRRSWRGAAIGAEADTVNGQRMSSAGDHELAAVHVPDPHQGTVVSAAHRQGASRPARRPPGLRPVRPDRRSWAVRARHPASRTPSTRAACPLASRKPDAGHPHGTRRSPRQSRCAQRGVFGMTREVPDLDLGPRGTARDRGAGRPG